MVMLKEFMGFSLDGVLPITMFPEQQNRCDIKNNLMIIPPAGDKIIFSPGSLSLTRETPYDNPSLPMNLEPEENGGFKLLTRVDNKKRLLPGFALLLSPQYSPQVQSTLREIIDKIQNPSQEELVSNIAKEAAPACFFRQDLGLQFLFKNSVLFEIDSTGIHFNQNTIGNRRFEDTNEQWVGNPLHRINITKPPYYFEICSGIIIFNASSGPIHDLTMKQKSNVMRFVSGISFCSTDFNEINRYLSYLISRGRIRERFLREVLNPYLTTEWVQ